MDAAAKFYHDILGLNEFWRGTGANLTTLSWINMRFPDGSDYFEWMLYKTMPEPQDRGTKNHLCLMVPSVPHAMEILKAR